MSQESGGGGGDKLWRCKNKDCTPLFPIPLESGLKIVACPFCGIPNPNLTEEDSAPLHRLPLHPESATTVTKQPVQETSSHDVSPPTTESVESEKDAAGLELSGYPLTQGPTHQQTNLHTGSMVALKGTQDQEGQDQQTSTTGDGSQDVDTDTDSATTPTDSSITSLDTHSGASSEGQDAQDPKVNCGHLLHSLLMVLYEFWVLELCLC